MAHHSYAAHMEPNERIEVRDRQHDPGSLIVFGPDVMIYLTPAQEVELLAQLLGRAKAFRAVPPASASNVRRLTPRDQSGAA